MKQVIVVRNDLKMGKGKLDAQCCHACLGSYEKVNSSVIRRWESEGSAKVVLKVSSLDDLFVIKEMAKKKYVQNKTITVKDANGKNVKVKARTQAGTTIIEPTTGRVVAMNVELPSSVEKMLFGVFFSNIPQFL